MEDKTLKIPGNVNIIQFTYDVGEVEFYRLQLSYYLPHLNNTMITMLAYMKAYGLGSREKLLEEGIITSTNSYYTYRNSLKKSGYINSDNQLLINISDFTESPLLILSYLKPNKEKHEVFFKHYKPATQSK